MGTLVYRSYAKVNLTLEVLRRREDGYHELASLVHTISLADELRMGWAEALESQTEGLDLDPSTNLVTRAAYLLASAAGVQPRAALRLLKRIPAAAGLGGGSSDAATTLVGLDRLWNTRLSASARAGLAGRLGSDVPFFLRGGASVMRGRGEQLERLPPVDRQWLIVVIPPHELSNKTAQLYAALNPSDFSSGEWTTRAADRVLRRLPLRSDDLVNAFERAARSTYPGLTSAWATVEQLCRRRFVLSGSGPALFALASDGADARREQTRLARAKLTGYATRTIGRGRTLLEFAAGRPIKYP